MEQNTNFDKLFEQEIAKIGNKVPSLLLHVCCAPCLTACLLRLLPHFDITLYYSNDNIHPKDEWQKRLDEINKLVDIVNSNNFEVSAIRQLKLAVKDLDDKCYFDYVQGLESEKEGGMRCTKCFELRLGSAFDYASANGFDYFATTLTVSPYKNSKLLNEIGYNLQNENTLWLPTDFKKHNGYNKSIELCAKYGIYRQHYCGCTFSNCELTSKQQKKD